MLSSEPSLGRDRVRDWLHHDQGNGTPARPNKLSGYRFNFILLTLCELLSAVIFMVRPVPKVLAEPRSRVV